MRTNRDCRTSYLAPTYKVQKNVYLEKKTKHVKGGRIVLRLSHDALTNSEILQSRHTGNNTVLSNTFRSFIPYILF
jgi:hypothetical protein